MVDFDWRVNHVTRFISSCLQNMCFLNFGLGVGGYSRTASSPHHSVSHDLHFSKISFIVTAECNCALSRLNIGFLQHSTPLSLWIDTAMSSKALTQTSNAETGEVYRSAALLTTTVARDRDDIFLTNLWTYYEWRSEMTCTRAAVSAITKL